MNVRKILNLIPVCCNVKIYSPDGNEICDMNLRDAIYDKTLNLDFNVEAIIPVDENCIQISCSYE